MNNYDQIYKYFNICNFTLIRIYQNQTYDSKLWTSNPNSKTYSRWTKNAMNPSYKR